MTHQSTFVLRVEGLNFAYQKDDSVLKGVSFAVERGQIVCLLGPSGCGKSTLLRIIAGLLRPLSGHIWIDEKDQSDVPTYRRNLGFVFQDAALFPHLSVEENLAFPFKRGRRKLKEPWTDAVNKILKVTGLESYRTKSVATLSGGQAQRVALARALVYQPSLLLLDEPLSSLDNRLKSQLLDLLMQLHDEYNASFIYVTHDEREALRIGTHVLILNEHHELQQFGPILEVLKRPATPEVAATVGGWNLLRASITQEGSVSGVRLENGQLIEGLNLDYPIGTPVVLGLPVSATQLAFEHEGPPREHARLRVQILRRTPWYASWLYECFAEGQTDRDPAKISCYRQNDDEVIESVHAFAHFEKEAIRVFK